MDPNSSGSKVIQDKQRAFAGNTFVIQQIQQVNKYTVRRSTDLMSFKVDGDIFHKYLYPINVVFELVLAARLSVHA